MSEYCDNDRRKRENIETTLSWVKSNSYNISSTTLETTVIKTDMSNEPRPDHVVIDMSIPDDFEGNGEHELVGSTNPYSSEDPSTMTSPNMSDMEDRESSTDSDPLETFTGCCKFKFLEW